MENNNLFFEIKELPISDEFSANMVMVENNGDGPAYLGWCETLTMDTVPVQHSESGLPGPIDIAPGVLILPFADLGILSRQGTPIAAPAGWREMTVRLLDIKDYLLVMIETELELNVTATS